MTTDAITADPIRVRRIEARDEARWRELFGGYIAFYGADVADAVIDLTWTRLVGPEPVFIGLVAVDGRDHVLGFALALLHASTWSATSYCYLEDLFVDPAARARGVGRALVEAVYAEADRAGATRTYWVTDAGNAAARRLYDSLAQASPFVQYRR